MIELSVRDQEFVNGTHGEAAALAMRILIRSAELMGAERLLDITSAHIDGCLYHGQASLDFVECLLEKGGRVAVPTTLNVGSMDLIHPELFQGSEAQESQARKLCPSSNGSSPAPASNFRVHNDSVEYKIYACDIKNCKFRFLDNDTSSVWDFYEPEL